MRTIDIAGRKIGAGHPCFIIAEAGVNHNGSLDLALRLVDAAAEAGADAVKFQTFKAEKLVSSSAPKADYQMESGDAAQTQLEMVKSLELDYDSFRVIAERCGEKEIIFLSTPFDRDSVDFLDEMGMLAFKVGSGDLTNYEHLRHVASKNKPVLLSTGMADWYEVADAVKVLYENGTEDLAIFHCVSSYPAPASDCNLMVIPEIPKRFGVPPGWSDHTRGIHISLAAVSLGACLIEKHLTLNCGMEGPDHASSIEPDDLRRLVKHTREIEAAIGGPEKRLRPSEINVSEIARRSLHTCRNLEAGYIITEGDLVSMRPGTGISPLLLPSVIGRRLNRPLKEGEILREEDLD